MPPLQKNWKKMLKTIKDVDLFEHVGEYDVVLIGTNTYCTMSQGIQLKVMLNYHYVQEKNMERRVFYFLYKIIFLLDYYLLE